MIEQENSSYQKQARPMTLRDVEYVLFRHKGKMLLFFGAVVSLVFLITLTSPQIYESEAQLLLKVGRESVTLDPTVSTGPVMHVTQTRRSEINSEIQMLRGRDLAEKIVDTVGPEQLLMKTESDSGSSSTGFVQSLKSLVKWPKSLIKQIGASQSLSGREQALLGIYDNLYIASEKESNIINISYTAKDPHLAQDVVANLISLSLAKHIEAHRTPGSYEFFVEQTELLKNKLKGSEEELRLLKNEANVTSIERQQTILLERIQLLEVEKDTTSSSLASAKAKVKSLEESISQIPETTVLEETTGYPSSGADAMREELFRLQIEEQKLLKNFAEDSRSIESIRKEIARAEELLKQEQDRTQITKGLNRSYEELQLALMTERANLVSLEGKLGILIQQIQETQKELAPLNQIEMEIAGLTRDISIQESNLRKYSENLEQARIDDAMESRRISNISVAQEATLPIKPIRPNKKLNLALGIFLGMFGAILIAVLSELMDHTIKCPEDIEERLQIPNLGYIPKLRAIHLNGNKKSNKVTKNRSNLPQKTTPSALLPSSLPVKSHNSFFDIKEQLLQRLNGSVSNGYVIGVTSYHRREGVSSVVANVARFVGNRYPDKVLVIDANTAFPSLHKQMGVGLTPGLVNILQTGLGKDALKQRDRIRVIPAGLEGQCLADEQMLMRFSSLLEECKKEYQMTIVDIPALEQGAFVPKITSLCDGVITVVESEKLRWEVAQQFLRQLNKGRTQVIGAVLNKRRFYIPKWIYNKI